MLHTLKIKMVCNIKHAKIINKIYPGLQKWVRKRQKNTVVAPLSYDYHHILDHSTMYDYYYY